MSAIPCTTVAGRHAAQLRRQRERSAQRTDHDIAREHLALAASLRGLTICRHFDPALGSERALWIDCRHGRCPTDHQLVYALLDELGWQPDTARLSRQNAHYDTCRLTHQASGAALCVIIKLPKGEPTQWEAA